MNWNELVELIQQMKPEERETDVIFSVNDEIFYAGDEICFTDGIKSWEISCPVGSPFLFGKPAKDYEICGTCGCDHDYDFDLLSPEEQKKAVQAHLDANDGDMIDPEFVKKILEQ